MCDLWEVEYNKACGKIVADYLSKNALCDKEMVTAMLQCDVAGEEKLVSDDETKRALLVAEMNEKLASL